MSEADIKEIRIDATKSVMPDARNFTLARIGAPAIPAGAGRSWRAP